MTNTHKLKGWNPDHEPEVELYQVIADSAFVFIDGDSYQLPLAWLEPLGDNNSGTRSTETD